MKPTNLIASLTARLGFFLKAQLGVSASFTIPHHFPCTSNLPPYVP